MPVNALVIRALLHYYGYYGNHFTVECPTGSGRQMNLYGNALSPLAFVGPGGEASIKVPNRRGWRQREVPSALRIALNKASSAKGLAKNAAAP